MGPGRWTTILFSILIGAPAAGQNLLSNPGFTRDLSDWNLVPGVGSISWDARDAGGSGSSGSARLVTPASDPKVSSIFQCVRLRSEGEHLVAAKVYRPAPDQTSANVALQWFEDDSCRTFLAAETAASLSASAAGDWQEVSATVAPPPAARSVAVRLVAIGQGVGPKIVQFDDAVFALKSGCIDDATTLCLNDGRFRVTSGFRTGAGQVGDGRAVLLTEDSGYFWFFDDANVEVVVKVLDACTGFDSFWVFAAGLTNVEVEIRVEDVETQMERIYGNPLDRPFEPIQDTAAFLTCP